MRRIAELRGLNPITEAEAERVAASPVFDEFRRELVDDRGEGTPDVEGEDVLRLHDHPRYRRRVAIATLAAAVALIVSLVAVNGGNSGLTQPVTTAYQGGTSFHVASHGANHKSGTWRLVDDLLTGTWQQNADGPPPGYLDCPAASACYAMSGRYTSAMASAPLLGESLYASADVGATWTAYPMPRGFQPTSPLECADATTCAAGGTEQGQSVFVVTSDGGHTFTTDPLPNDVGTIYSLSCPTRQFCGALVSTSADMNDTPKGATFLSTSDGGAHFTDTAISNGDSMSKLSCTTALDCTAVGTADANGTNDWTVAGVAAMTVDGGSSWTAGTLPNKFAIFYISQLSCADAEHCSVTGLVPSPDPGVRNLDGGVASTNDGGMTWSRDAMPGNVPNPDFSGLACPTAAECWASGEEAVPAQVDGGSNADSPVLLGTTDGGTTWSKVTFSVPAGAPDFDGQSYLSMGFISCPTADVCASLGAAAQGSPTTPVYSLVVPPSG